MSQENVELVRQAMEALLRGDRDAWFAPKRETIATTTGALCR